MKALSVVLEFFPTCHHEILPIVSNSMSFRCEEMYYLTMVASTELHCHYHWCPAILMCDVWDLKGLESQRIQILVHSDVRCVVLRSCYEPTVLNAWGVRLETPFVHFRTVFSLAMFRYLWTVRYQQACSRYWQDRSQTHNR